MWGSGEEQRGGEGEELAPEFLNEPLVSCLQGRLGMLGAQRLGARR